MASELLRKLLEQNKYLRSSRFLRWPSRDRHQLWATAWLALRLLPGRALGPWRTCAYARARACRVLRVR